MHSPASVASHTCTKQIVQQGDFCGRKDNKTASVRRLKKGKIMRWFRRLFFYGCGLHLKGEIFHFGSIAPELLYFHQNRHEIVFSLQEECKIVIKNKDEF
jgi:hypothetical protein